MIKLFRMDCLNVIKLLAALTFVHEISGQTVSVSGPPRAAAGTNISLTCIVTGGPVNLIQWVDDSKTVADTIYSGSNRFSNDDKYNNFILTSSSATESVMVIVNAEVEDDGVYRCDIPTDNDDSIDIVVEVASTKTLTLTSIVTTDNEDMYVATCDAVGGKPQETITWTINGAIQINGTDGNMIYETNPPATAPLSNIKSVFTFPATLQNYGQTLVCLVSGHDMLTELNGQESVDLNIHSAPSADDIMTVELQFLNTSQEVRVSCNISDDVQPIPRIRNYYIFSNGIQDLIQKSSTGVNFVDVQQSDFSPGFEFDCVAGNYLGNITTYDPPSTTTLTPTTTAALETTTLMEVGSGGNGTAVPTPSIAGIVGGVVGGIVVIVIIVIAVCYCKKEERFCFEAAGTKSSGSSKPAGSAVGSSNGSEREKTKPEAAPRGHGSIQHTNDNPNQDMYAMVDKKPSGGRGGDAPDRGSGPGQNEPQGMLYADLDLSHKAGHTDKHVPKNENDVVVYSSILV